MKIQKNLTNHRRSVFQENEAFFQFFYLRHSLIQMKEQKYFIGSTVKIALGTLLMKIFISGQIRNFS
jgi:hypothetical protein